MKTYLLLTLLVIISKPEGYTIQGQTIRFTYPSEKPDLEVYLSGNFNSWSSDKEWKMGYRSGFGYELVKPIDAIKRPGRSFYEFTFSVNGKLLDANSKAINVIHCAGYGARYTIDFQ